MQERRVTPTPLDAAVEDHTTAAALAADLLAECDEATFHDRLGL